MTRCRFKVPHWRDDFNNATVGQVDLFRATEQIPIRIDESLPVSKEIGRFVVVNRVST